MCDYDAASIQRTSLSVKNSVDYMFLRNGGLQRGVWSTLRSHQHPSPTPAMFRAPCGKH